MFFISDVAEKEISSQSEQRKSQHKQVLNDLKKLQDQATKIWTDIGFNIDYANFFEENNIISK